jgi:hypothetical protein
MFRSLGTPAEHKRRVVYDASHSLPRNELIREFTAAKKPPPAGESSRPRSHRLNQHSPVAVALLLLNQMGHGKDQDRTA